MIEAKGLVKIYLDGQHQLKILDGLNFRLSQGESVSIMGPSGCGKSTLVACLAGLTDFDQGQIEIEGIQLKSRSHAEIAQLRADHIGIIFQQFHLLPHLTAYENARLPADLKGLSDAQAEALAWDKLDLVHLRNRADHLPHMLSRGECQRVAIARALVQQPRYIIADEPTASLDSSSAKEVMALLVSLTASQNLGLLIVTHDPALAQLCKINFRFNEGRLQNA